ncbi:uncharacterized protein PG986_012065 [Apiospora aurea]|uniref:Uncharacterized protein n=1 Tax=Apiospora aurea TaxID=335848 RepID=A0ABR1PZJ8_9PEZI
MKVSFELTAVLLASSAHLASTTSAAKASQRDNVRVVTRDQGAGPLRLGMLHPRQASGSLQQQKERAACDMASFRAATERMRQLLSDFRGLSAAVVEQLESMEALLRDMGGAADGPHTPSSVTDTADGHSRTTSVSPSRELTSMPVTVVPGGAETGSKEATTMSGSRILTSTALDSNQTESSKSAGRSATTGRIATTSTPRPATGSPDVLGSAQTLPRSSTEATRGFPPVISTAILPDASQIKSSGAVWKTQSATESIAISSRTAPGPTTRSLGVGLTASSSAPDRASGSSSQAEDRGGNATDGLDRESTVTIIPTETRIITVTTTSRASFIDLISSTLTRPSLKTDPFINNPSTIADAESSSNSQRIPSYSATASGGSSISRSGRVSSSGLPTSGSDDGNTTGKPLLSSTGSADGVFITTPTSKHLSSMGASGTTLLSTSNIRYLNASTSSKSSITVTPFLDLTTTRPVSRLKGSSSTIAALSAVATTMIGSIRGSNTTMSSFHITSVDSRGSTSAAMPASASASLPHLSPSDEDCSESGTATHPPNSSNAESVPATKINSSIVPDLTSEHFDSTPLSTKTSASTSSSPDRTTRSEISSTSTLTAYSNISSSASASTSTIAPLTQFSTMKRNSPSPSSTSAITPPQDAGSLQFSTRPTTDTLTDGSKLADPTA